MEQKCIKSDIFVNENYFCDSLEQAIDVDFSLPDYCPDISKIFKCNATPRIVSKSINGNNITLDGNVIITLLYCDKDGKISSFEYNYPFSKNIELSQDVTGCNIITRIKCDYINCRAVTGRKVDIHGAVGIFLKVFKRKCTEIISDIDDCNIETNKINTPVTVPMGCAEKYLSIEEDLPLGSAGGNIESILKVNSSVVVKETRIINDKAVVKGELVVCVLFLSDENTNPQVAKTVLPYSQIVDIEGITDSCKCDTKAEISFIEVKPKPAAMGEIRCFGINAKILLTCEAYCGNEIPIICDAFSRKYMAEIKRQTVSFQKIIGSANDVFHCKKSIETDIKISSVIDLWCSIQGTHGRFDEDNLLIDGTLLASLMVCDMDNNSVYIEKPIEFQYKYPFKSENLNLHCEPEVEVITCGYTITSDCTIELSAQLQINAEIYEKNDVSLISELLIDESKSINSSSEGAMIVYFTSSDDTVWDIANKYTASVKEIMEINGLEDNELPDGSMILIPLT